MDIEELRLGIEEYIDYYNNRRIKEKLKGLTPVEYRNQWDYEKKSVNI